MDRERHAGFPEERLLSHTDVETVIHQKDPKTAAEIVTLAEDLIQGIAQSMGGLKSESIAAITGFKRSADYSHAKNPDGYGSKVGEQSVLNKVLINPEFAGVLRRIFPATSATLPDEEGNLLASMMEVAYHAFRPIATTGHIPVNEALPNCHAVKLSAQKFRLIAGVLRVVAGLLPEEAHDKADDGHGSQEGQTPWVKPMTLKAFIQDMAAEIDTQAATWGHYETYDGPVPGVHIELESLAVALQLQAHIEGSPRPSSPFGGQYTQPDSPMKRRMSSGP